MFRLWLVPDVSEGVSVALLQRDIHILCENAEYFFFMDIIPNKKTASAV